MLLLQPILECHCDAAMLCQMQLNLNVRVGRMSLVYALLGRCVDALRDASVLCCPNVVCVVMTLTTGGSPCRTFGGGCTTESGKSSCRYSVMCDILRYEEMEEAKGK